MKALVIGVVLVFLGDCASHVNPGDKAIELPIKEYFGQDPIECRAFGEGKNGAEAEDPPPRLRLTPRTVAPGAQPGVQESSPAFSIRSDGRRQAAPQRRSEG